MLICCYLLIFFVLFDFFTLFLYTYFRSNRTVSKRRLYDSSSDDSHDYRHRIWWDAKMRRIVQHELEWQRQNMLYAATLPRQNNNNMNNNLTYNTNSTYTTSLYSSSTNNKNILSSHRLHPKHGRRKKKYPRIQHEIYANQTTDARV